MPKVNVTGLEMMEGQGLENRGSWVDRLRELGSAVSGTRQANPAYMPFEAGTPTLGANQLIESARQHAAEVALKQAELNRKSVVPDQKAMGYSMLNATRQIADERWSKYVSGLGLQPGQIPSDTQESEKWINATMPGLKSGIYDLVTGYGGNTKDAEDLSLTIENLLRSRAGVQTKLKNKPSEEDELNDVRSQLFK